MSIEQHALGEQKVSITVVRKTKNDLVVSQHSAERWFRTEEEAVNALRDVLEATIKLNDFPLNHENERGEPHEEDRVDGGGRDARLWRVRRGRGVVGTRQAGAADVDE